MSTPTIPPAQTRPVDHRVDARRPTLPTGSCAGCCGSPRARPSTADEARSAFQKSILISATRCVLMYIFFPFVLPLIGVAKGVGPVIGVVIGMLAIVSITFSIRRFWRADHSKRWHYTIFGALIIGFLIVLAVKDFSTIVS